jgi:hypothetical protein
MKSSCQSVTLARNSRSDLYVRIGIRKVGLVFDLLLMKQPKVKRLVDELSSVKY